MVQFSSLINGLARNMSIKNGKKGKSGVGREAADALAKEAKKNELLLTSSGVVNADWSSNYASAYSRRGQKGTNQDSFIVWEGFGSEKDVIFCGVFDGHGPWGHFVAQKVRKLMPSYLLCNWQEALTREPLGLSDDEMGMDRNGYQFNMWKKSYLKACSAIDQELEQYPGIDSFHSGTTALSIIRQGDLLVLANVGDSRAVLATTCDDSSLIAVQLTVDFKPNLPQETERIQQSKGKVCSAQDEPGVYRIWMPTGETLRGPGLALSRAFGDYFIKDFGLISEPDVTRRTITSRDQFVILATDGVWDVLSNQEAVEIVSTMPQGEDASKRLVEHAASAWKRKRRGLAKDDISAICLFFQSSSAGGVDYVSQAA